MNVLGISGSLRRDSHNTKLLRSAGEMFRAQGVGFEIYPDLKQVPPYDEDDDHDPAPAAVARLRAAVAGAEALFFVYARVQLLGSRPAEECRRLALAAGRAQTCCATSRSR